MRKGQWPEISEVSGIECVGEVDDDPSGTLERGQTVAAIMGGMGRTRRGSYAEYTCAPRENVFALRTSLPWVELAAIPESYATAWTCVSDILRIGAGQVILVRAATSALGQAAVNIARAAGAVVLATTRNPHRVARLRDLGAATVFDENEAVHEAVRRAYPAGIDGVLDLVGNRVLRDSLLTLRRGGQVCQAGFLGGAEPVEGFNPFLDVPSGVALTFFGSFVYGTSEFPASEVPMQTIVERVQDGTYRTKPAHVFPFDRLADAHRLMESNQANGKIVVVV
jgi:NADPH:quinone reductase-like Zn-dependent oxidoreductase